MKKGIFSVIVIGLLTSLAFFSCKKNDATTSADIEDTAQQVGDVMASIDESGGSSSTLGYNEYMQDSIQKTFDRYSPGSIDKNMIAQFFLPEAQATSCGATGFSSCTTNQITRNFGGCTVGSAVFSGDVTLTWGGGSSSCTMASAGDTVTRVPNFTVTGRRSATLTVTKTGTVGQKLTWASGTGTSKVFNFTNDGINRKFTVGSTSLFDQTTTVTSQITVTGTSRSNRVISGGTLHVVNNLTSVTCDFIPTNVTWSGTSCNCPTSGSWSGTCSDGKSVTLDINGCGTANFTQGSTTTSVSFDRCGT